MGGLTLGSLSARAEWGCPSVRLGEEVLGANCYSGGGRVGYRRESRAAASQDSWVLFPALGRAGMVGGEWGRALWIEGGSRV